VRKPLLVAGIGILILPWLFVIWLFVAAHWSAMDTITAHAPVRLRKAVASVAMNNPPFFYSPESKIFLSRIVKLDPDNGNAWERRCLDSEVTDHGVSLESCETAVRLQKDASSYRGLGDVQEFRGDFCAAEKSFKAGADLKPIQVPEMYSEDVGLTAFLCGDFEASRIGFETAIQLKRNEMISSTGNELSVADRNELLGMQLPLIAVYQRMKKDELAAQMCKQVYPDWKVCRCTIDVKGTTSCNDQ
jgi:hypothetical protein